MLLLLPLVCRTRPSSSQCLVLLILIALLLYDTILTLPEEIEFIWRKRFRLAALLYFLTRYPAILLLLGSLLGDNLDISLQVIIYLECLISFTSLTQASSMVSLVD